MSFDLLLADPPWRYSFSRSASRRVENQYPTMSVEEICAVPIPANADAVLYLWATAPKLREALRVVEAWGFDYRTHAVWTKRRLGMGYWFRNQHELLLVAVRGQVSPPPAPVRTSSLIEGVHAHHSKKPDTVYEMLERQHPEKTKIELFARWPRRGWVSWGNEIEMPGITSPLEGGGFVQSEPYTVAHAWTCDLLSPDTFDASRGCSCGVAK